MTHEPLKNTFSEDDVLVLLNELPDNELPGFLKKKETAPDRVLMEQFYSLIDNTIDEISYATLNCTKRVLDKYGKDVVLISLLRGGLFAGIGIKESIRLIDGAKVPHYAVSLIKNSGLDFKAMDIILQSHPDKKPIFIDGWIGRGALYNELKNECDKYLSSRGVNIEKNLAVIVDVFGLTPVYGTNREIFMPESLFGSNLFGLIGRTGFVSVEQFHFTRMYHEFKQFELTQFYTSTIKEQLAINIGHVDDMVSEHKESIDISSLKGYLMETHNLSFEKSYCGASECHRGLVRKRITELIIQDEKAYYAPPLVYMADKKKIKITNDSKLPLFSVCRKEK